MSSFQMHTCLSTYSPASLRGQRHEEINISLHMNDLYTRFPLFFIQFSLFWITRVFNNVHVGFVYLTNLLTFEASVIEGSEGKNDQTPFLVDFQLMVASRFPPGFSVGRRGGEGKSKLGGYKLSFAPHRGSWWNH